MSVYSKKRTDGSTAWYYNVTINKIRYRAVGGTTKTQALRALEKVRTEVLNGTYNIKKQANNPLIEKFAETYLERRQHIRSRSRDELSVRTILFYFKGKTLQSIVPSDIEDYIAYRRKQVKNATINRELACLKRMFNLAIKWGDARINPVKEVDMLEEPAGRSRYLTIEESQKLIECSNSFLKPIIITALNTGMRLQEILKLTWDRVHFDNTIEPYIEIDQTKNNQKRFIPLNDDLAQIFESLRGNHPEYVFIGLRGKPLQSVKKPFATALNKAGITNFKFHDLRHTFASHFVMCGGDLFTLKEILGHSSLKMVLRYAHLASAHKRKMLNNLNGKFSNVQNVATKETNKKYNKRNLS